MFQWNRPSCAEETPGISALTEHAPPEETCCEVDRVQLHAEKRDPLHRGRVCSFLVDLKSQPAEVTEHHIPVFAQQCSRLGQNEPVVGGS